MFQHSRVSFQQTAVYICGLERPTASTPSAGALQSFNSSVWLTTTDTLNAYLDSENYSHVNNPCLYAALVFSSIGGNGSLLDRHIIGSTFAQPLEADQNFVELMLQNGLEQSGRPCLRSWRRRCSTRHRLCNLSPGL